MTKVIEGQVKKDLKKTIKETVAKLGGFKKFIKQGEVVLLKPNFNTADPFPASTDLGFLKSVIELVYECHPKMVMVGDSSTMSLNTRRVMEELGVFKLEEAKTPPRIYVFDEREWIKKEVPQGKFLKKVSLTQFLERTDRLILLPCLKTHSYAQFSGALKLSVGFMKPLERVALHLRHLQEKIAELNTLIHPDLIIMDARKCFIAKGPAKGKLREPGLILASWDRVAIDIRGIEIIQSFQGNSLKKVAPYSLPQIKRAIELGLGEPFG